MDPIRDPEGREMEALQRAGAIDGRNVLEIGCGSGRLIWRYASMAASAVGVDLDSKQLAEAVTTRPQTVQTQVAFLLAGAEKLPFPDETFQCAILGWSL